ncbi:hypothetical protein [Rickettsia sp. MEAM1 (Bemisia tabaci)]|nr:hypothetical protein [Rickettsia sp. MEAM1 (Bemisia tabaci)]
MLLLFYKSFPVIAQYLIYTSLNLTVPPKVPKHNLQTCCVQLP